jgi:predicted RNA-binding Zn-ribbon protein involved in translation (DUF1610 family)
MTGAGTGGTAAEPGGAGGSAPAGERQVPFYCPYCGEETLTPAGPAGGEWQCGACLRGFRLRFTGVAAAGATGPSSLPS